MKTFMRGEVSRTSGRAERKRVGNAPRKPARPACSSFRRSTRRTSSSANAHAQTNQTRPNTPTKPALHPSTSQLPILHSLIRKGKGEDKATHPFTIDRHLRLAIDPQVLDLPDLAHLLHIRRITPRAENDGYLRARVDVVARDQRPGRVIDERRELHGYVLWVGGDGELKECVNWCNRRRGRLDAER